MFKNRLSKLELKTKMLSKKRVHFLFDDLDQSISNNVGNIKNIGKDDMVFLFIPVGPDYGEK